MVPSIHPLLFPIHVLFLVETLSESLRLELPTHLEAMLVQDFVVVVEAVGPELFVSYPFPSLPFHSSIHFKILNFLLMSMNYF